MEILKKIFNNDTTKEFISRCENVAKKNPTVVNNGIGVNYSKNEIESIKIYYGFHHRLSKEDVNSLFLFGNRETYDKIENTLTDADYNFHPYFPTGVSFALKIDKNMKVSIGHFMMPELQKTDSFFQLEKVRNHYSFHDELPVLNRKGIFTMIDSNGEEHYKDYFYVTNDELKKKIGQDFNVNTDIVPSIEWVLGKGFYSGSSINDEKIVLQSNYSKVYEEIIRKEEWKVVNDFNKIMKENLNIYCVCPGYYKTNQIKSYYYFNGQLTSASIIDTITKIQNNLHQL